MINNIYFADRLATPSLQGMFISEKIFEDINEDGNKKEELNDYFTKAWNVKSRDSTSRPDFELRRLQSARIFIAIMVAINIAVDVSQVSRMSSLSSLQTSLQIC